MLKLNKPLPEAITCLLYVELDNSVLLDITRTVTTDFEVIDTVQILCKLRDVNSLIDVFPSDLLPHSIARTFRTLIINVNAQTERGSHWLAVHF